MLATALTTVALLPGLLTPTVAEVNQQTPLPILRAEHDDQPIRPRSTASGDGDRRGYQIVVSTIEDCGANACSLAYFSATKGGTPYGPRKATLANGRKGRYNPLSCGGVVLAAVDHVEGARRRLRDPGRHDAARGW